MPGRELGLDRGDELEQDLTDVADDRDVGDPVLADLGRVDVGVDDGGVRGEGVQPPGDPVVEARAEGDEQIRLLQRGDRGDRAVHPGHSEVLHVAVREGAPGHQRGDDRNAGQLGQPPQLGAGVGLEHATADVQDRSAGSGDQPGGFPDLLGVRTGHRPVAGQVDLRRPAEVALLLQHVLRDVDQDRAWAPGRGEMERLGDRLRHFGGALHEEVVFGDRQRDAGDVRFLEGVGPDHRPPHLPGDRDHRHRVHIGVGDRGHQVGGAGTRGGDADSDLAGGLRISLGRMPGALLVAHQDVADTRRVVERVVGRQDGATGDPEDDVGADLFERADERLRTGHRRCIACRTHAGPSSIMCCPSGRSSGARRGSCNKKPPVPGHEG